MSAGFEKGRRVDGESRESCPSDNSGHLHREASSLPARENLDSTGAIERRIFRNGAWLTLGGALVVGAWFTVWQGLSFASGGLLGGAHLAWTSNTIGAIFLGDARRSQRRVLAAYFLRLLLIPLCLYAMIRFLFLGAIAVIAGFALFHLSILVEGVLQALGRRPK